MWWTFLMRRKNPRGCHLWGFLVLMKTMIDIKKEAVWKYHTASWPVRESNPGLRRERASSWPLDQQAGIEATRFELATSASRTQRSTKLSHASMFLSVCFALFTSDLYIIAWPWKKCKRFFEKNWKSFKKLKKPFKINIFTLLTYISKLLWIT